MQLYENKTRQDAFSRIIDSKIGSFVEAKEEYLLSLREFLFAWIGEIENKLADIHKKEQDRIDCEEV